MNSNHVPGYEFPSYAVVPAGGKARLYIGSGTNTPDRPTTFYWGQKAPVFENAARDQRNIGDGAYLFDPEGDLRADFMYPCLVECVDPMEGKVRLDVQPKTPERISISNVSDTTVDLDGYIFKLHLTGQKDRFIWGYPLSDARIEPGETLEIFPDGSPSRNERLRKYLGRGMYVLTDGGNTVSLRTTSDIVVDCHAWGRASC
jgi:hypothetical protein